MKKLIGFTTEGYEYLPGKDANIEQVIPGYIEILYPIVSVYTEKEGNFINYYAELLDRGVVIINNNLSQYRDFIEKNIDLINERYLKFKDDRYMKDNYTEPTIEEIVEFIEELLN